MPSAPAKDTAHFEQASGKQTAVCLGKGDGGVEDTQSDGKLIALVEVGQVKNLSIISADNAMACYNTYHLRDETTLSNAKQSTKKPKAPTTLHRSLNHTKSAPQTDYSRRVPERPNFLTDETTRELSREEGDEVNGLTRVVIIRVYIQIIEHVVGYSTVDVSADEIK